MAENETNPKTLEELYEEGKRILLLSSDYVRLELGEKLTILISTMILIMTLLVLILVSLRKKREDQPPASLGLSYFREER